MHPWNRACTLISLPPTVSFSLAQLAASGHAASRGRTRRYDSFAGWLAARAGAKGRSVLAATIANDDRKSLLFTEPSFKSIPSATVLNEGLDDKAIVANRVLAGARRIVKSCHLQAPAQLRCPQHRAVRPARPQCAP